MSFKARDDIKSITNHQRKSGSGSTAKDIPKAQAGHDGGSTPKAISSKMARPKNTPEDLACKHGAGG